MASSYVVYLDRYDNYSDNGRHWNCVVNTMDYLNGHEISKLNNDQLMQAYKEAWPVIAARTHKGPAAYLEVEAMRKGFMRELKARGLMRDIYQERKTKSITNIKR